MTQIKTLSILKTRHYKKNSQYYKNLAIDNYRSNSMQCVITPSVHIVPAQSITTKIAFRRV